MTPCRFDGLAAGAFVALALRDKGDWRRLMYWAPRVGLASGTFLLGMVLGQRHLRDDVDFRGRDLPGVDSSVLLCIGLSVLALLFASLVAVTVNTAADAKHPLQRIFRNPALRSLGLYSYAMYVFHPLLISLTKRGLASMGVQYPQSSVGALLTRVAAIPVFLAMAYAVAFLSYHLYEKHFLALKRFFPSSRKPTQTPAGQVETTATTTPVRRPQFERHGTAVPVGFHSTEPDPSPGYRVSEAMRGSLP
jgi:peptidoglycan/LPS O-acetylase OafA/YrhL